MYSIVCFWTFWFLSTFWFKKNITKCVDENCDQDEISLLDLFRWNQQTPYVRSRQRGHFYRIERLQNERNCSYANLMAAVFRNVPCLDQHFSIAIEKEDQWTRWKKSINYLNNHEINIDQIKIYWNDSIENKGIR